MRIFEYAQSDSPMRVARRDLKRLTIQQDRHWVNIFGRAFSTQNAKPVPSL